MTDILPTVKSSALRPYPAYNPSGIEWLGDVPAHWEMLPGRACYEEKSPQINTGLQETTVLSLSFGEIVIKPPENLHGLVPASFETYQIIEPRDIIVRPTDLQNDWNSLRFGLSSHHGIITSAYMCLATSRHLSFDYGHLVCHAYDLKKVFYGLGSGLRQNLSWRDFKYLPCPVPPLDEQTAIVRYLDRAGDRIRSAISTKERLIELLTEQRQTVIHRAVTRGLDPNVPLKPSGVEWLGDVPKHWESTTVKRHYNVQLGKMLQPSPNSPNDVKVPYLKAQHVHWNHIRVENPPTMWASQKEVEQFGIRQGDLLIVEGGAGATNSGLLVKIPDGYIIQNALHRVRAKTQARNDFLLYLMMAVASGGWFEAINNKATIPHFTKEKLDSLPIPRPPLEEQTSIVRYLDKATADINTAIANTQRQIDLLREYRTRLIADVVTGQVDVREQDRLM